MTATDRPIPLGRLKRTLPLTGFTARAGAGRIIAGLRQRAGDDSAVELFHERTAERYTEILGHSKGALMKAGQILSMIDVAAIGTGEFAPYQRALSRLRADAPPMHSSLVHQILCDEIGSASTHFDEFGDEPVAAASIGQVHRATLRDGRAVAVKIQYPGVGEAIRNDLANAELLATFLRFATAAFGVSVDVRSLAHEATARIVEEVDYRHEAAMITAFHDLYVDHPFVRIPEVVPEASSDRVLTMSYMDGMDWVTAQHADQHVKNTWAEAITRFLNGNYRHANLVHADPHPENFRFSPDGAVSVLDFGCVQVCPEDRRWSFVALMRAAFDGRTDDCRLLMTQMGLISSRSGAVEDVLDRLISDLAYIVNLPQPVTYTAEVMNRNMRGLFGDRGFMPAAHMTVTPEFVFLPRTVIATNHMAGVLHATLPMRAVLEDMDGLAPPTTELGELHHAWVRARGLPGALDHRVTP